MEKKRNQTNIDIVILAAGIGSRLYPLTEKRPKCLVDINGQSILERIVNQLHDIDCAVDFEMNVIIASGYLCEHIQAFVSNKQYPLEIVNNDAFLTTNNMYSFFLTFQYLNSENELVIINGDCLYDKSILASVIQDQQSVIAVDSTVYYKESMKVKVRDGIARSISKKLPENSDVYTSIDLYKFSGTEKTALLNEVSRIIDTQTYTEWTEVAINNILKYNEVKVGLHDINGKKWVEVDTFEDLEKARKVF